MSGHPLDTFISAMAFEPATSPGEADRCWYEHKSEHHYHDPLRPKQHSAGMIERVLSSVTGHIFIGAMVVGGITGVVKILRHCSQR